MTDERELDRAIDTAAGRMIRREPSSALSDNVVARVREGKPPAPRRLVLMTVTAGIALCAAIAIALVTRVPTADMSPPPGAQLPIAQVPIAQPPMVVIAPVTVGRAIVPKVSSPALLPPDDFSVIDPIETQPIALSTIDVPQLEHEATLIETLDIEPLTIEALATSND
jgi:hypothetical protein